MVLFCIISATSAQAQQELEPEYLDSVEVSLLTCSPHEEIYSLYGHSALRWHDLHQEGPRAGEDLAFNWGIFNFDKPYFVARFVFGLTDYELGVIPYQAFCSYYEQWGSSVTEQVLNLTNEEKQKLKEALANNLLPENRIYRYNFFYDNCSTRPRDIVEKCINGKVEYAQRNDYTPSYREMVGYCTRNHPWATFGNDILLGIKADWDTDLRQQEFLPGNLLYDFDRAQIYSDGTYRQLVSERRMAVNPGVQIIEEDFPLTPMQCALILLAITIGISIFDWKRKKRSAWYDTILFLMQGLAGCVLFAMLFSQHPTTSTNLQILLINPVALGFIPSVIRKKNKTWPKVQTVMLVLFFIGSLFQHYAEGMLIVALCLLLRVIRFEK
ncbi:MAG: DUF4105 domain-containing protein [Prevotella sp.]|nr:DUF4105 domain-containing protein [Prevotella sp.]